MTVVKFEKKTMTVESLASRAKILMQEIVLGHSHTCTESCLISSTASSSCKGFYRFSLIMVSFLHKIIPNRNIYVFNEGNYQMWDENLKKYIDGLKLLTVGLRYSQCRKMKSPMINLQIQRLILLLLSDLTQDSRCIWSCEPIAMLKDYMLQCFLPCHPHHLRYGNDHPTPIDCYYIHKLKHLIFS